ncbi:MAG TPA: acetolactate synthase small subunit [Candidatus Omnitrophica bacterium]|nr:MAG: acetolactate synthase small subunit [Omnitrophica WOR_2 bacterium GWA2_45_18]OGX19327.1 MAG: acetolactate synthase small subunit [Omnitrophica WOR_2 bacterium GWC2_45_7]HBR14044.1 acetolactate synthase small subunit [Candidatus Omnitrophota bacterium]
MSPTEQRKDIHTISLLVANKPGVLVRVALVFSRRGYNIDSLVVSPSFDSRFSRMTITAQGDPKALDQIIKQVSKLIDVIHASEHTGIDAVHRELALVKVKSTPTNKAIIPKLCKKHNACIIDESPKAFIIKQAGTTIALDEFETMLRKYGIIEMVRSGKLVMAKGKEST